MTQRREGRKSDAEARGSHVEESFGLGTITDAAGGFDVNAGGCGIEHESDRFGVGARSIESCGGFNVVGMGSDANRGEGTDLVGIEENRFENDLEGDTRGSCDAGDGFDIGANFVPAAGADKADVADHVDFIDSLLDIPSSLIGLGGGELVAVWETKDDAQADAMFAAEGTKEGDVAGAYAKGFGMMGEAEAGSLEDFIGSHFGFEDGDIEELGERGHG